MGLGELLLPSAGTTHGGSFVVLYLSGDDDVSPKELALDVCNDRGAATKIMVQSYLEGLLAVKQEPNRCILQILHFGNLLDVTLDALEPEVLVLGLGLNVEFLENMGPDGSSRAL